MGGGVANKGQANTAFSSAQGTAARAGALSQDAQGTAGNYNAQQQALYKTLFGGPGSNGGGAVTPFLDPSKLNISTPQGPYALQYTNTAQGIDTGTQQALAAARRSAAQRGFGASSPSGFEQNQELQATLGGNAAKGQAYQTATTNSYQDALNNFWKAVQSAQGQAGTSGSEGNTALGTAASANQGASNTYGQLYGTAGAYHPSAATGIIGSALGAAGSLGSAALTGGASSYLGPALGASRLPTNYPGSPVGAAAACVCEGTPILTADGSCEEVENLKPGDAIRGPDEHTDVIDGIEITSDVPCWLISTDGGNHLRASGSHTLARSSPGYVTVERSMGVSVLGKDKSETVTELASIGKRKVYKLKLRHAHAYLSGNLWSLE